MVRKRKQKPLFKNEQEYRAFLLKLHLYLLELYKEKDESERLRHED